MCKVFLGHQTATSVPGPPTLSLVSATHARWYQIYGLLDAPTEPLRNGFGDSKNSTPRLVPSFPFANYRHILAWRLRDAAQGIAETWNRGSHGPDAAAHGSLLQPHHRLLLRRSPGLRRQRDRCGPVAHSPPAPAAHVKTRGPSVANEATDFHARGRACPRARNVETATQTHSEVGVSPRPQRMRACPIQPMAGI